MPSEMDKLELLSLVQAVTKELVNHTSLRSAVTSPPSPLPFPCPSRLRPSLLTCGV